MFCKNCGAEIDDKAAICPNCGVPQKDINDSGSAGWGILGCCIPVLGAVLYLVWRNTKPNNAKSAGIGALVGAGLMLLSYIGTLCLGIGSGYGI